MKHKEIIDGLKFTMDMILFDPSTGEVKIKEQLNDLDRTTYDACEGAIEIIKNLPHKIPNKNIPQKPILNPNFVMKPMCPVCYTVVVTKKHNVDWYNGRVETTLIKHEKCSCCGQLIDWEDNNVTD